MKSSEKIDFRVSRDVGQVFNVSFRFMRQNRTILFKSVTYYIMPFILFAGFLIFYGIGDFFGFIIKGTAGGNLSSMLFSAGMIILGFLAIYLAYTMYITLIYEYMLLYHQREDPDTITHQEVWQATRKRFFIGLVNVFVWGVAVMLLSGAAMTVFYIFVIIGMLFGIVFSSPVIIVIAYVFMYVLQYLLMFYVQSLTFPMLFLSPFERIDVFSAFGRTFSMVNRKGSFFNAIGANILGGIVLAILHTNMVTLPIGIIAGFFAINGIEPASFLSANSIWVTVIFKGILPLFTVFYFYTMVIYLVTQAFETLNLDERLNGKGVLERISRIGTRKDVGPEYYDTEY